MNVFLQHCNLHKCYHKLSIDVKLNQYNNQNYKKLHKKKGQVAVVKSFHLDSLCKNLVLKYCNLHKCHHKQALM